MTSKNCTKCNKIKLLSDFHNRAASKDGLCYICKKCNCAKATSYRNKNIDKVRKKDKERSKSKDRKYTEKSIQKNIWHIKKYVLQCKKES